MMFSSCVAPETPVTIVPKEHELTEEQKKIWLAMKNQWFKTEYASCLRKHNLKMSCSNCEYVYIRVRMKIDNRGRLVSCTVIQSNVCGREASEDIVQCFTDFFKTFIFPQGLRSVTFETMLGTGLSC